MLLVAVLVVSLSKKSSCWPESTRFLNMAVFGSIRATWNSVNTTSMCAHMRVYKRQGVSVSSGWFFRVIGAEFFLNPESHSGYFLSQFLTNFISNRCNSTFFMSLLNNRGSTLYFYTIQNTVLIPCSQRKGTFFSPPTSWLSVRAGKRQYSGVFFDDSGTTCFQQVSPLFLFLNPGVMSSWMRGVRFFLLKEQQKRNRKSEEQRGVTAGGEVCVCVRAASSSPPPPSL